MASCSPNSFHYSLTKQDPKLLPCHKPFHVDPPKLLICPSKSNPY